MLIVVAMFEYGKMMNSGDDESEKKIGKN